MTKIKLCGLTQPQDIAAANELHPDYIGLVFAEKSRRRVTSQQAAGLKSSLSPEIPAVGVFLNNPPEEIVSLCRDGIIDIIQLHGTEDEDYLTRLRRLTDKPIIRAFVIRSVEDIRKAEDSSADLVLLDGGTGDGTVFDWQLLHRIRRPYFLAGGLNPENVADAVKNLHPFAVDVSSGIETEGKKDYDKMKAFLNAVRKEEVK